jgi:hypothetical protein
MYFCGFQISFIIQEKMEVLSIEQKRIVRSNSVPNNIVAKSKQYSNLADFMKGTISGDELVKYVCGKLDEKYSTSQLCGLGKRSIFAAKK